MSMQFIARTTVQGYGQTSIVVNNIPNTFDDLLIRYNIRSYRPSGLDPIYLRLNSNLASPNYQYKIVYSWNTGDVRKAFDATANQIWMGWLPARYASAKTYGSGTIRIPNYAGLEEKMIGAESFFETSAVNEVTTSMITGNWISNAIDTVSVHCGGSEGWEPNSTISVFGITRNSGSASVS